MREYQADPIEDHLLLQWYARMTQAGELESTLGPLHRSLSQFFAAFQPPCKLLYETDGQFGICVACWYDPSPLQGAFFGLWVAEEFRHSKVGIKAIAQALDVGFTQYQLPVVLVVTAEPRIAKQHVQFGFTALGDIPSLYGGQTAHVAYLTADAFAQIRSRYLEAA